MKRVLYIVLVILIIILTVYIVINRHYDKNDVDQPVDERVVLLQDSEKTVATVYYATEDKQYLVPVNVSINATKELVQVALEKLIGGPSSIGLADVIPDDTKLLEIYGLGLTVMVNLTDDFLEMPQDDAKLAINAMCATILPLAKEYKLSIQINGKALADFYDLEQEMPFTEKYINIVKDQTDYQLTENTKALVYYLPDANSMYLVPQTFFAEKPKDEADMPQAFAKEMLKRMMGSQGEGSSLTNIFWKGTELLDLDVVDGVAYVDFSGELIGYGGGNSFEGMLLNSLLYSLCGIDGIDSVQLLIDGSPRQYLPEGRDISKPLAPTVPVNSI